MSIELKKAIKKKFGTMSNFARLANLDRYWLQKQFARKVMSPLDSRALQKAVEKTRSRPSAMDVDPKKLDRLREAVMKSGGVVEFCKQFPDFNPNSLKQILGMRRKRLSPVIRRLFEHFLIE